MHSINQIPEPKVTKIHKLSPLYRFFCWCSGARLYILKQCPSDFNKYYGIGVVVFLTGLLASISGGYAMFTVFRSVNIAIAFGILWGFLIFSIDWYLVASLRKHQRSIKEFGMALPRFILAVLIAFVISKPLEMKLFEREIEQQILFNHQQKSLEYQSLVSQEFEELTRLEQINETLRNDLKKKEEQRNRLFEMIIAEAEGQSPTRTPGKGPVYREKREEFEKIDTELLLLREQSNAQIQANSIEIEKLKERRDQILTSARSINKESDGFLARLEAMGSLSSQSTSVRFASIFILLLFIVIESSPMIVKLMSARGPYDDLLEAEEYLKQVEIRKVIVQAELTEDHRIDLHRLLEKERNEKLYEVEKNHILTEAKVLGEINELKVQKWKKEELRKLEEDTKSSSEDDGDDMKDDLQELSPEKGDPGKHFISDEKITLKDKPDNSELDDDQVINNPLVSNDEDSYTKT